MALDGTGGVDAGDGAGGADAGGGTTAADHHAAERASSDHDRGGGSDGRTDTDRASDGAGTREAMGSDAGRDVLGEVADRVGGDDGNGDEPAERGRAATPSSGPLGGGGSTPSAGAQPAADAAADALAEDPLERVARERAAVLDAERAAHDRAQDALAAQKLAGELRGHSGPAPADPVDTPAAPISDAALVEALERTGPIGGQRGGATAAAWVDELKAGLAGGGPNGHGAPAGPAHLIEAQITAPAESEPAPEPGLLEKTGNFLVDIVTGERRVTPEGEVVIESPEVLRWTVPGQVAWDEARSAHANDGLAEAALHTGVMAAEMGLTVATAGMAGPALQGTRAGARAGVEVIEDVAPVAAQAVAPEASAIERAITTTARQVQSKFKHAEDFGVAGNYNTQNAAQFEQAIQRHLQDDAVQAIAGTYRGQPVTHFVNPETGLNVIRNAEGQFVSGWRLGEDQLRAVLEGGSLGGG